MNSLLDGEKDVVDFGKVSDLWHVRTSPKDRVKAPQTAGPEDDKALGLENETFSQYPATLRSSSIAPTPDGHGGNSVGR